MASDTPTHYEMTTSEQKLPADKFPEGGYGWVCVICTFFVNAHTWGVNSAYGVFLAYYLYSDVFPGTTAIDYAFIAGLSISVAMFISPLATYLSHKATHRFVLNLGTILETLSLITTSFAKRNWELFLSQGVCFGLGLGFCYIGSVGIISHWFEKRRSVANGIAAAGSGFGGMVYSLATSAMISHLGFPWAMRILGILCFSVNTVCGNLLRVRGSVASKQPALHFSLFKRPEYLAFLAWGALSAMAYIALLFSLSSYSVAIGLTQHQGSIATALLNLGQAIGRPAVGLLSDKLGRIEVALTATFLAGFLSLVMWIFAQSIATIYAFAILVGLFSGTIWAAAPALGAEVVELSELSSALCFLWFILAPPTSVAEVIALQLRGGVAGDKEYLRVQLFIGFIYIGASCCLVPLKFGFRRRKLERAKSIPRS
ncbi:hypothetical protein DTO169E5_6958 [Paecilomyces variotii]|nr:hypothetical protein DTO169E5_6958 [Paecilomyces variotii]KAJ9251534.1 hypothetical protein DTO195F2_7752 [Paecilomyces variotii]KAJ9375087.1 hypothetical protein DTO282E5_71 [Paecilomyces variotii]KAJ9376868.1 hypothetical protein DTO063F5_8552 [Paecilomyces variotii]